MNTELYRPGGGEMIDDVVAKGRRVNKERDQDEENIGLPVLSNSSWDERLRTAIEAIACGIRTKDVSCFGEAIGIIQDVEIEIRVAFFRKR